VIENFIRTLDIESTGIDPAADQIIEAAFYDVYPDGRICNPVQTFVKPSIPIPPESRAVHHLSDEDVAGGITLEELRELLLAGDPVAFCAHNSRFEESFLKNVIPEVRWLDTYRAALRMWPEAPRHTNQVLRYWLDLEMDEEKAMPPHRALPDAFVTANILSFMIFQEGEHKIKRIAAWSKQPGLLPKVLFGKHRGKTWAEVPFDYLQWICDKADDMDEDVKFTAWQQLIDRQMRQPAAIEEGCRMGKVIGALKAKHGASLDMGATSAAVKAALG
jgi:exodeoxyribonuclease X